MTRQRVRPLTLWEAGRCIKLECKAGHWGKQYQAWLPAAYVACWKVWEHVTRHTPLMCPSACGVTNKNEQK